MFDVVDLEPRPRESVTWRDFLDQARPNSIALDGYVRAPPMRDFHARKFNFDHHEGVVRDATMSTCRQVLFAIKGGLFELLREDGKPKANVYVNDSDQDTSLAVWLLENYKMVERDHSIPHLNRLIDLTDRLDVTGGGFPLNLRDKLLAQHNWVFEPYNELRRSGALASIDAAGLTSNIEAVMRRLDKFVIGEGGEKSLNTEHRILYDSQYGYKIIDEIGGNEARYYLFSKGLDAFISLVATRPDGGRVWSVGRRSPYIPFP
ncbi:MAG: hypothetical protein ABIH41_04325, partial [Nanoarchaeota archaeon]